MKLKPACSDRCLLLRGSRPYAVRREGLFCCGAAGCPGRERAPTLCSVFSTRASPSPLTPGPLTSCSAPLFNCSIRTFEQNNVTKIATMEPKLLTEIMESVSGSDALKEEYEARVGASACPWRVRGVCPRIKGAGRDVVLPPAACGAGCGVGVAPAFCLLLGVKGRLVGCVPKREADPCECVSLPFLPHSFLILAQEKDEARSKAEEASQQAFKQHKRADQASSGGERERALSGIPSPPLFPRASRCARAAVAPRRARPSLRRGRALCSSRALLLNTTAPCPFPPPLFPPRRRARPRRRRRPRPRPSSAARRSWRGEHLPPTHPPYPPASPTPNPR